MNEQPINHRVHDALQPLMVPIDAVRADPNNVMDHDDRSIEAIALSLQQYGQDLPLIAASDGRIKAGNGRLAAARKLGWTHIAVLYRTDDEITLIGRAVADNRTAQLSTWNRDTLAEALAILKDNGDVLPGWSENDLDKILNQPEPELPPTTNPYHQPDGSKDQGERDSKFPEFKTEDPFASFKIHFENEAGLAAFGKLIGRDLTKKDRGIWFIERPQETTTPTTSEATP